MDGQELIREARQGSAAAQKCLFYQYADRMLLVCRRYVKSGEDAEERMLDGFYRFFHHLGDFQYQGEAATYAWLKKIMVNECLRFLRKKTAFTIVAESDAHEMPVQEEVLASLSAAEIFQLVLQLPVGYRTVFNLVAIEGMTHGEVAELLGITESTSRSQLSKAKTLLQKMLTKNQTDYGRRKSR